MGRTTNSGPINSLGGFEIGGVPISGQGPQQPAIPNQGALTVTGADATAVAASATTQLATLTAKMNAMLAAMRAAGMILP